jgi:uncharacterized protein YjiS (DUF1127 family)
MTIPGRLRSGYQLADIHHRIPPYSGTRRIALLTAFQLIAAAIRIWRRRARSRQQLRELNDHLLKDIGLSREVACYEAAKSFWR